MGWRTCDTAPSCAVGGAVCCWMSCLSLASTEQYSSFWYSTVVFTPRSGLWFPLSTVLWLGWQGLSWMHTCCAAGAHCNGALPLFFSRWRIFKMHKPATIHAYFINSMKSQLLLMRMSSCKKGKSKWTFHYSMCTISMWQINPLSLQVFILAFKVDWLIMA